MMDAGLGIDHCCTGALKTDNSSTPSADGIVGTVLTGIFAVSWAASAEGGCLNAFFVRAIQGRGLRRIYTTVSVLRFWTWSPVPGPPRGRERSDSTQHSNSTATTCNTCRRPAFTGRSVFLPLAFAERHACPSGASATATA